MGFKTKINASNWRSKFGSEPSVAKLLGPEAIEKAKEKGKEKTTKASNPYAEALKKDPKLGEYVKQRKNHKPGSAEYEAIQAKINKAYGKTRSSKLKTAQIANQKKKDAMSEADKMQAIAPDKGVKDNTKTRGKNQNASKITDSAERSAKDVAKAEKRVKVDAAKTELKTVKKDNKQEVKDLKKTNKVEKINAKADVAATKGKTRKAERLADRAERKATGKTRKEQGRNIFGGKTRKQKKKEAAERLAAKNNESPAKFLGGLGGAVAGVVAKKALGSLGKYKDRTVAKKKCDCGKTNGKCNC